jgi:HEAT repeat protein
MTRLPFAPILALCLAVASPAAAQSNIRNADVRTRAAGDLMRTFQELSAAEGPHWIGYSVAAQNPDWNACCHSDWSRGRGCCTIEENSGESLTIGSEATPRQASLEGGEVVVLIRVAARQVNRVRTFSQNCEIDAGGRTVHWLTGVQPAASVALLAGILDARTSGDKDRIVDGAMIAIAAHADPAADLALERLIAPERPLRIRKQAAFWAANSRGRTGFELVRRAMERDTDDAFRRHAIFALSQGSEPDATNALIHFARKDASARVRGEALFWLAQKAGRNATGAITEAIDNDPDTKVKERAVFALSQLPKDEGVPKLIEVARTNRNAKVRQQAMFWLGQSRDTRALEFFEEILTKKSK